MRRKPHARKRCEQTLKARSEVERGGGERNGAHAGHHQGQAARHKRRRTQRALAYLQKAELPQDAPTLIGKQVEHRDHDDDCQQRRHRRQNATNRHPRHGIGQHNENCDRGQSAEATDRERRDQKHKAQEQLGSRVQAVDCTIAGIVTAKRKRLHQQPSSRETVLDLAMSATLEGPSERPISKSTNSSANDSTV